MALSKEEIEVTARSLIGHALVSPQARKDLEAAHKLGPKGHAKFAAVINRYVCPEVPVRAADVPAIKKQAKRTWPKAKKTARIPDKLSFSPTNIGLENNL